MSVELKIKIKSLAEEARIIRKEEDKLHGMAKWKLQHHRKTVVRNEARRALIAYLWILGRDWEAAASTDKFTAASDFHSVVRMIQKYGGETLSEKREPDFFRKEKQEVQPPQPIAIVNTNSVGTG